ncbi:MULTISPECIES: type VI secretion system baseplate subunit TssE [Vibrio]|uniref:Putative type VI secretion system protein n=1 Tax=Vibrio proteolyticus NBRC 13287 TaxID=1219065 RepID=U3BK52_VIBPR|nr:MULTISPECIES: type VI secretion system baseplate subunit TssE [Vibrio]NAW56195.1 type VI secretion system baseplate subunit TssE [Vibrio sp. V36_P2S2PM302]NAX23281.1 type VI secretion system baseplate subunit TssE [Vibrio sp. V39_P1S14PM300]NAX26755.1 type VI secretion system baseplate subunit TssE [Vibrio sp. V38_P2S17PM301]NAX29954.1 type VI secretion system baseplate subunit TssE [Vibrio sp. V37_P2S8PM304]GAD67003.1 putative type VI secretion system protein [Vibrio proteolyticus NBRC 132
MEKGYRLLERIELGEPKNCYEKVVSHQHLVESIHIHLADLLNTHAGNAMIDNDYGLPDFNDVLSTNTNLVRHIQQNIRTTIEKFEPRLKGIEVFHRDDFHNPLQLSFGISGEVTHNGGKVPMSINVFMGVDGQFNV